MKPKFRRSLYLFHRDLRLTDNVGFNNAITSSKEVIPAFIIDDKLLNNPHPHHHAFNFLLSSLIDLHKQLQEHQSQLLVWKGNYRLLLERIIKELKPTAIFHNQDFTPYSYNRDRLIEKICKKYDLAYRPTIDIFLHNPHNVKTNNDTPYQKFSAFYKKAVQKPRLALTTLPEGLLSLYRESPTHTHRLDPLSLDKLIPVQSSSSIVIKPGRQAALETLSHLKAFANYQEHHHDINDNLATTNLSSHLRFGNISSRELAENIENLLGPKHELLRQLYWREFFLYISYFWPTIFNQPLQKSAQDLTWKHDSKLFTAWVLGQTGFPLIDAAMTQLRTTGRLHNRLRMLTASFLTKHLGIYWKWGERYFASQLVDYEPAVNAGNWQWSAGIGFDTQPYIRILNPWQQQKLYDAQGKYIKKWLPIMTSVNDFDLQKWANKEVRQQYKLNYPEPIVDHKEARALAKKRYQKISKTKVKK